MDYSKIERPKLPPVVVLTGKHKEDFIARTLAQVAKLKGEGMGG